jgi:L-threonylcarbamoyladenylate synthase
MAQIGTNIETARQLLENGQLVAIPTETVYGLAANALNEDAVLNIFEAKNRPQFDPLIVHTDSIKKITNFVSDFSAKAQKLAEVFWPGPLTLLLPKKSIIPDLVTSGLDTVAVRIPNHALTLSLLSQLPFPLAAPSANPFGYISPTSAQHVETQLGKKIDYILDGGQCTVGIESTIVGFENNQAIIYRLGGVSVEAIEAVIGKVSVQPHSSSNPKAPGMLKSHYSPRKKLVLSSNVGYLMFDVEYISYIKYPTSNKIGYLAFQHSSPSLPLKNQRILSPSGDFGEAAKNLFAYLRALDELDIDVIYAELLPEENLGRAINDRIRRAAAVE